MPDIVKYYCPNHKKELLFTEYQDDSGPVMKFFTPERPATCQKCKKAYYKSECVEKRQQQ